uniref:Si:dkey-52j6.3 n=1 Tax=Oncorhynchus mykiss TaxID=8022 RepID=A0A8C7TET0_ONCMY
MTYRGNDRKERLSLSLLFHLSLLSLLSFHENLSPTNLNDSHSPRDQRPSVGSPSELTRASCGRAWQLPALQLNYLSDLVYLDVSNNTLMEISESTFGNLRKLAYLDLSFNTLTQLEDRTFGPLSSLVMLRLTDNLGLNEIHPDAFSENIALQVLDVSRNNLTTLNISSLIALPSLRSLGLSGNPWRCDCETEDLCLWVQIEGFKFQGENGDGAVGGLCVCVCLWTTVHGYRKQDSSCSFCLFVCLFIAYGKCSPNTQVV